MSTQRLRFPVLALLVVFLTALQGPSLALADEDEDQEPADEVGFIESASGDRLEVDVVGARPIIGEDPLEDLKRIPGSGLSLKLDKINTQKQTTSLQEAVRGLPGVNVRDEVLSGAIPNIGIRGLNPDRSEKMLILEDGVPAGLAPYSVNAAYYVPPIERMDRIELLKGSGQVLYGPHTVGGVLNMITPEIPLSCGEGFLRIMGGSEGYLFAHLEYGGTHGKFGYWVSALTKRGDGLKDHSEFDIHDITGKFRYTFSSRTNLTLKLNYYDSEIEATYLGLTEPMWQTDPRQNPAHDDLLEVSWSGAQLTLQHFVSNSMELLVNVYGHEATRDWDRQDFARNTGFAAPPANTERTEGDTSVDGGAIYMRASFGSRDREFAVLGIEPRLIGEHCLFSRPAEFHVGARYHYERFINARHNRATYTSDPMTRSREVDDVHAFALFGQERVSVTNRLGLSAGLRVEHWRESRDIRTDGFAPADITGDAENTEWIPGGGFTYDVACNTIYGGVHRGFAPPRLTEAIDSSGDDVDLDAERSWNYELGIRGQPRNWLHYDATAFYMDFENQIVPANESGGASTENTNAGETVHYGFELALQLDLIHALSGCCEKPRCQPSLWFDLAYTHVETENTAHGGVFDGNELPYAPNNILRTALTYENPRYGLTAGFVGTFTDDQFSDQANTRAGSNDGLVGIVPSYWVFDAAVRWAIPRSRFTAEFAVNNLFDESYIASRAPAGIHVGAERHLFLGFEVEL